MKRRDVLKSAGVASAALAGAVGATGVVVDENWRDAQRQRELPMRIRWPADGQAQPQGGWPLLVFSHGLGGSRAGGEVWGMAWADAGFVVLHVQHAGSDLDAVRQLSGGFAQVAGLRAVANAQHWLQRMQDVVFVLDEVVRRQASGAAGWSEVRPRQVGLSGHSFGAHTTLGMAGQAFPGFAGLQEPRLAAFIALSPAAPARFAEQGFANITRPTLCITGTRDEDVLGTGATPERRLAVYQALPAGNKALLLLQDADHMSFAGQTGPALEIRARAAISRELQARHHALVARVSTDWWRASLTDDAQARARLAQPEGLAAGDVWQRA